MSEKKEKRIADQSKIELLFESDLSTYRISQVGDMNNMTVYNMRVGDSDINRMQLQTAIELTEIYETMKKSGELK